MADYVLLVKHRHRQWKLNVCCIFYCKKNRSSRTSYFNIANRSVDAWSENILVGTYTRLVAFLCPSRTIVAVQFTVQNAWYFLLPHFLANKFLMKVLLIWNRQSKTLSFTKISKGAKWTMFSQDEIGSWARLLFAEIGSLNNWMRSRNSKIHNI